MLELTQEVIFRLCDVLDMHPHQVRAPIAVLLVSLICGMVGSMVVGNRMAFFSDAMAHCAFAGIAFGLVTALLVGRAADAPLTGWFVPTLMVTFSALVGMGIAFVRERTSLANDTVIGVFFAGAIGFGALMLTALRERSRFDPESFIFGNPWFVTDINILFLLALLVLTIVLLQFRHNDLVFASVNTSLARSRGISLGPNSYLFIVLLAMVVNFSIVAVGVLLINGLLIVPAAVASNLARNLRQMFWLTVLISTSAGMGGLWISKHLEIPLGEGEPLRPGPSGPILLLCVLAFFLSVTAPALYRLVRPRSAGERSEQPSGS